MTPVFDKTIDSNKQVNSSEHKYINYNSSIFKCLLDLNNRLCSEYGIRFLNKNLLCEYKIVSGPSGSAHDDDVLCGDGTRPEYMSFGAVHKGRP